MFQAVFLPMPTPFGADGDIDPAAIRSNIARWLRTGIGGVVALGSNGEAPLLDDAESDRVLEVARDAIPRGPLLIAGTGRESTRATIAASVRAAQLGADAVPVRTPSYFKSRMTAEALIRHYTLVADRCPVPVLLYNYFALTGVNLSSEVVARLSEHANIAGIKETGSDTAQVAGYVAATSASFEVIAGSAPTFYASLCVGARGGILAVACIVPELCVMLFEHFRAGRHEHARELQRQVTPLANLVTSVYGVPGLKAGMDLAGYSGGEPRLPLLRVPDDAVAAIRRELTALQSTVAVKS